MKDGSRLECVYNTAKSFKTIELTMRASHYFLNTLKETPSDAEIVSHQYMLRAGMIRKLGAGLYSWLPLGLRVLKKIEQVVREEMNRSGALEILMPAIQPAELWQETGRWETFGGQLLTMNDHNQRSYCFGPTHEEVVTDLMRAELQSYKQLPLNVYQIQTKFRDEIRPRYGVMRAREFVMKDAYSFHLSAECLQKTYDIMVETYNRIFTRLGLTFRAVEADTGAIGGAMSHEFQVLADAGEDVIFYSDKSSYAANVEQATYQLPSRAMATDNPPLDKVATPSQRTIEDVAAFLQCGAHETVKTLMVVGETTPVVALVLRGDDTLNEIKAAKHPWIQSPIQFVDETKVAQMTGCPFGFLGPVGLSETIPVIVDHRAAAMPAFICGANEEGYHYRYATWGRDVSCDEVVDLRNVQVGDPSPDGQGRLQSCRGIEVGHVFQLGDKYAQAMQATVINAEGQNQVMLMGCYGLGVSRLVAAAIEQHHDERGIIWPKSMAPFTLVLIPLQAQRSEQVQQVAGKLYQHCLQAGIDVIFDDRNERPGVLFADYDLIGVPHRIVISERNLSQGMLEYKARAASEVQYIPLIEIEQFLTSVL